MTYFIEELSIALLDQVKRILLCDGSNANHILNTVKARHV